MLKIMLIQHHADSAPCCTILCKHVLFSHDTTRMSRKLRAIVTHFLQEFDGGMGSRMTPI
jgi:hypothetical protein